MTVLDAETEQPLAGVMVRSQEQAGSNPWETAVTEANGSVELSRPVIRGDFYFVITARLEGFVSQSSSWSRFQRDGPEDIPTVHVFRMSRGVRIGGRVQDPEGNPVPDATVTLIGNSPWVGVPPRDRALLDDGGRETVSTDSQGKWSYAGLPSDWSRTEIQVQNPEFIEARFITDTSGRNYIGVDQLSGAALLAESAVISLSSGFPVTGRVEDLNGMPVPGARIVQNRDWGNAYRSTDSMEDGSFQFRNASAGTQRLTVQAPGFAATLVDIPVPTSTNVVVRLAPGRVLRARVVDGHGDAVTGAEVECASPPMQRPDYRMKLKTDGEGRIFWDQAPSLEVPVVLHHPGFLPKTVTIPADGVEATIFLNFRPDSRALRVTGRVVDGETGALIDRFRVLVGEGNDVVKQGRAGAFEFTAWEGEASVEIRAPGYAPIRKDLPRTGSGMCSLDFRLVAAVGWSGQVLLPNGCPAPGTEVALITANKTPTLGNRRFIDPEVGLVVTTDADGGFAIDPQPSEIPSGRMLVAVSQAGYAEHDADTFRPGKKLTLQPWARIEGVVPGRSTYPPELKVHVVARPWLPWMPVPADPSQFGASPDPQGRFVIESVPPGYYSVGLVPQGSGTLDKRLTFQVLPGKMTRLDIPELRGSVRGRLVAPAVPPDFDFAHSTGVLERRQSTPVDLPRLRRQDFSSEGAFDLANQEYTSKLIAYWKSTTGLSAWMEQRSYAVQLGRDGSWVAPAVPPGDYDLKVIALERPPGRPPGGKCYFLKSETPVQVGALTDGRDEFVEDMGQIPMELGY
ncbi:MAG: carboxypeptidase-like regulatory domain-containing protein [Verrucomicrobiota bacterium]